MLYDWDSVMLSPQTDLPSKDGLPMPQADQRGGVSIVGAKRQESLERVLLRELSHRMNNELAVAIATVAVAAKRCNAEEGKEILGRLQERLESQARVHHALRMPECATTVELAAYIDDLCRAISRSRLESRGIELSLSLHSIAISAERCWLLGMIISELLTNASRHAFGEGRGSVRVELMPFAGGARMPRRGQRNVACRSRAWHRPPDYRIARGCSGGNRADAVRRQWDRDSREDPARAVKKGRRFTGHARFGSGRA